MQSTKKLITLIVIAIVAIGLLFVGGIFIIPQTTGTQIDGDAPDAIQTATEAVKKGELLLWVSNNNDKEVDILLDHLSDNPDLFWLDTNITIIRLGTTRGVQFKQRYDNIEMVQNAIESSADQILSRTVGSQMTDYEKVIAIHDWMCDNIEYEEDSKNSDQDIYGALVNKRAVCAGYAKAFAYLLNKIGIECEVISGTAKNMKMEEVPHAWNRVLIDGKYSYWDVTWDDAETGYWTHNWCGVSSKDISNSHYLSETYFLKQADDSFNYYYLNGMYLNKYSASSIGSQIKKQGRILNIKCADRQTYNDVISALSNSNELQKIMRSADINHIGTIKYIPDPNAQCIRLTIH